MKLRRVHNEEERRFQRMESRWRVIARNIYGDGMQFYAVGPITLRYLEQIARVLKLENTMILQNLSWSENRWITVDLAALRKDPYEIPILP